MNEEANDRPDSAGAGHAADRRPAHGLLHEPGQAPQPAPDDDLNAVSVATFDRHAGRYAEKYFGLHDYDELYRWLLPPLPSGGRFLDLACGPGNVSAFVAQQRPDVQIVGIDRSPNMVREAQTRVPGGHFLVADCRALGTWTAWPSTDLQRPDGDTATTCGDGGRAPGPASTLVTDHSEAPGSVLSSGLFDAAAFSFGLSYLDDDGARSCLAGLHRWLAPGGVLLLTSITGATDAHRIDRSPSGDRMFTAWRTPARIVELMTAAGFEVLSRRDLPSPANASVASRDLALLTARR